MRPIEQFFLASILLASVFLIADAQNCDGFTIGTCTYDQVIYLVATIRYFLL